MKFKREIIALILILSMLFTISAISAADSVDEAVGVANDTVKVSSVDISSEDNLEKNSDVEILGDTDDGSFAALNTKISGASGTVLLENDYEYKSNDTITAGININGGNLVIDGQGHKIDAKGHTRFFNVNSNNVTIKNINFVNGYSSNGPGAIYANNQNDNCNDIIIQNCTFINNHGVDGAIYFYYAWGTSITDSTFINNTGSNTGAVRWIFYGGTIDKCIFINNTGSNAGSIYWSIYYSNGVISNSIFINNSGTYDVLYNNQYASNYGNTLTAENSWWGLTKDNYKTATPKVNSALKINKQYVLDLNLDGNGNAFVSLNNLLEDGVLSEDTNYALPTIDLDVKGEDIEVPSKVKIDGTGKNTIVYTPADSYLLTVGISGAEITRGVDPTFISLQNKINNDISGELSLKQDYNYDSDKDSSLTSGIEITKSLTIDGNGHFIDAKGLSNIFYFNDDTGSQDLILKNIIFRNAVGTDGAVVYFKGNKIEVINCTFTNNDASGQGDVLYINANSNENKITESSFINNVGSNSVIYMSPTTTANIDNSIFISNDATYNVVGSSDVVADYNWWGNTAQNYDTKITKTDGITVNKWLFLKIEANPATEGTATVSLNNLFDGNDKGNYDSYALPAIKISLGGTHAQCNPTTVGLNNSGQATFRFAMFKTTATLTASFEDITLNKELEYVIVCNGSFKELYDLIWFTPQEGVLNLEHDFKFIDGVDTIKNGIFSNKDITINGNGHTIDGDKNAAIFWFDENHVTLNNITFKNGVSDYGAAIYHSAQSLNVNYCTFINNQASDYGGAVYNYGGTNSFINCTFINNYGNRGGAVYDNGPVNTFINSTFSNNRASTGGAIYSYVSDNTKFANCTFENNSATNAGALYIYHSFVDSDNCTFKNNTANQGAVSYTTGYRNVITNSKFIKNIAKEGAVIYDSNSNVASADKCIFINNTATTALIFATYGYTLENSIVLNNSGTYVINSAIPQMFSADYNWFGNNMTNYDERPNVPANLAMGPWYVLDANATNEYATISLNNLYDGTNLFRGYSSYDLPNITLNTESTNMDVPDTITLNKTGKTNVAYTLNGEKGLLTVKNTNAVATTEIRAGDFNIIQKLVDENDVVELTRNFTYDLLFDTITEGIVIDRDNVIIKGNGHIIDAKGQSRIFKVTGSNVVIEDITFINAKSDENGGAIYFDGESGTVKSSVFTNNTAASGSAIYWTKNNGKVNDCVFIDNPGDNAIYAPSDLNADYNWFGNNASNYNKNIAKVEGFTLNNWYFLNITLGQAAATINLNNVYNVLDATNSTNENCALGNLNLTLIGENLTVQDSAVLSKGVADVPIAPVYKDLSLTASFGSASYNKTSSLLGDFAILAELISAAGENGVVNLDRNYNYIIGADTGNSGIMVSLKNLTINGNGFTVNANGKSRIFDIENAHNLTIKNITLTNGYSNEHGGAIYWKGAKYATIRDTIIKNSHSNSQGGAIYLNSGINKRFINVTFMNNTALTGGALAFMDQQSGDSNLIYGSTFVNNSASSSLGGGAIYSYSGIINITNSDFINNSAYSTTMGNNGGAIYISATADDVSIVNSTFRNNFAKGKSTSYGGAIYWAATDTLSIANSTFIGNDAKGGTSYGRGGVLYTTAGTHNIVNSTFLDNHAKSLGGVAYSAGSASQTNFRDSIFLGNYYSSSQAFLSVVGRPTKNGGSYNLDNCWLGNTPSDTRDLGVTLGTDIIVNNRLTLNYETDPYMVVGEDRNVKFVFTYVENGGNKVYDSSNLPKVNLTLTPSNGKVNKNNALMEENILFNADQRENVKITASYNVASLTVSLEVKYSVKIIAADEITIHVGDVDVPVPAKLSESAATGVINYRGGDEFIEVLANGYVTGLKYGTSVLTIFYTGDDNYAPTSIDIPVNVIKYDTEVQIDSDSITVDWGADSQKLTARVTSGDPVQEVLPITANINDINVVKLTQEGYLTFLKAGKANITLYFAGNEKYNPSEKKNITVTVNKVPSEITLTPNEFEFDYLKSNTTTLTLTYCTVDLENISVLDKISNPVTTAGISIDNNVITISNLDVGTYKLKVTTTPDENHTSVDGFAAITVNKVDSKVTFADVEFDYLQSGTTTLTLDGCSVDLVNISVVDHSEAIISLEGNVITVSNLDAGEYTLKVITTPDANHKSVENTSSITVNKIDSSITLSKSDLEFDYLQSDSVTITDYDGCSVDIENITVVGKSGNFIALDGGVITVSGLGAGDYTLKITTTPDKNHKSVDATANVKVNKIASEIKLSNENLEFDFAKSNTTELTLVGCTVDVENVTVEGHPEAVIGLADNVITVSGLNVGTYTLKVTTTPDENHTSVYTTANVKVNMVNSSVKFSNEVHLYYSETGSTTLILDGCTVDLVNISVVDHPEALIVFEGDVITISGLEEGQYTLNVTSTPDSNHYKVSNTTKIFVHKESPKLEMDYRNITVGETEIVYVTLGTDAEGNVTVTITQSSEIIKTVTLTMDTRMNRTSFSDLKVGQYNITAFYEGHGRYNSSTLKYDLEVRPIYEYEFAADVKDTVVDNKTKATVTLPSDATGKIVIGDIEVKITEPVTVIELPSSAVVGTNNVTVKYVPDADSKYAPRELVALYNVAKVDTEIVLEITNSTTANPVTIVANINATGNVTFIVNGKEYSRKITENKSTLELSDVAGGEYSVTAVYAGNAKYVNSTAGDKFTVEKIASEIEEFTVDPGEIQTDGTATVTVKVPGSGIVTITVNGKDTNVTVNEGVAELTLSNLPKGETKISAKYLGDDKYNGIETEEKTLTVKPVLDYDFTVDVANITVGDDAIAYIMLPSDATGNINVSVSKGKDVLKSENITSIKYVIPLKLDVGTYNITAKYYGNDKYDVKTVTKQFSVNPLNVGKLNFTVVVNDTLVGQETNVTVSLPSDATGKLVINGKEYEFGEKITLTPGPAGINNVTVRYVPDENSKYGEDNVTAFYNVAKKVSKITITPITGVKAGQMVFVDARTNSNGDIIVYIDSVKANAMDVSAGVHTVVASVAETDEYLASSANYTFTVTKKDVEISVSGTPTKAGEKSTVTVNITDGAKGIVVVNVNGTEYSIDISKTNVLDVVMPNAGTVSLSARYLGNDYYNAKDAEATTIEVTEKPVRDDYNVPSLDDVKVGDEVEIHVADDMDVYVDGVKQTPDENGNVTLPATAGEHSVVIVANETSENKEVFDVTTYNVAKNDVEISVSGTPALAGEKSTVTVNIAPDAKGIVVVNVNGTEYSLNISDNISIEVVMPDAGTASLSARYLGDDKYAAKDVKGEPIEVTEKQDGVIDIPEIGVIEVGETRTIDGIPSNVDIYIDGNKTVPVSGQVIIPSTAGAHTIVAMVNETPTTKAAVKVVTYEVVKKESKIEIEPSDIEVGKPVTITVYAGDRTVDVVYIDGKEYPVTDGYVEFTATAGTHTVIASLNETDEYLPVTANRTFEVYKKESEIEISSDDSVTVGQSIIISIDITHDTTGNVLVNVNGTVYSISLPERNLEIVLDKVGSYNITATYMGDDKFNGSVSNALTVNVEDKAVSKIDVQIPEDNRVGEEIVINVTSDVTPEVYVDGKKQNYRNGKVVIPSLEAGIHTIEVIIPETENNKANSTVKTFTVSKKDSSVKINGIDGDFIVDKFNKLNFNYEGNTVIVYLDGEVLTDYDLFKAAAGTHIITATVVEDSEYTSSSANYTFEIAKNTAEISVDGGYTTVGMKTTINVNIVDEATGIVIVNVNGTEYSLNISQTKSLDVVLTQPGEYDISARYLGDDKYEEAVSESAKIVVADKKDGEIIIDAPQTTVYAGDDIEISVTSYGDGELTVTVDGIEQTLDQGTLTINNISAGNHTIVAVTPETAEYKESREVKVIEVVKKDTEISINVLSDEIYAGDDVEVEILSDNDDIIVTVDGVIHTIENGILTIKNISAGSHTIEAVKYEDDEFNEYTAIEIIHAEKQSAEVSITVPQNVKAGDDVTIEVSSYDGADITVYVDGVKHEVNDGKVTIKATAGKHTVTAGVDETYTHLASNDTKTFDVVKKDASIEITATNVTEGQATTITVNTQLNEGIVVVKVGDKQAAVDLAKSKSVSITLDAPGTYEVSAEYLGSDIYAPAEASNITVEAAEKSSPEVNVTIPSVKAGEDETISVSIPNATGEVHVIVDGVDNIIPLDENGKANYTMPQMTAGDHSIVVVYPGDDTHDSKVVSQSITVDKQSSKADITVPEDIKAGETANVTVNIPGATGNVSVIIDGAETVVPLDENGSAVIPVSDIAGGKHSVVVVYDGDDTHEGFHDSKSFDVAQMKSAAFKDITVESSSISAVLADENGNPIKDALITYKINGKQSTTKTDDKGMFTINGISKAAVEFAYEGNDSIEPVNMSIDLQGISPIKTATEIKGEDFTQYACDFYEGERGSNFTFRLVDSQGKALANKQLYIGYNGVTLNRTTDANGYASVQINLKNAGLYTFVIVFLGDSDYNASMAVHKVTINKKPTSISASAKTFKATAKTKKYTVTLKTIKGASIDGKTYLAAGKKVTLKINGKTYTAKTNAKGQATFSLKITKKGKFTTKISFDGDKSYEASSKSVKITIK